MITTDAKTSLIESEVLNVLNTHEISFSDALKKLNNIYKITEKEYNFQNENAEKTLEQVTKIAFSKEIYKGSALNHIKLLLTSYLSEYYHLMYLVNFLLLLSETKNTTEILENHKGKSTVKYENNIRKHESQIQKLKI